MNTGRWILGSHKSRELQNWLSNYHMLYSVYHAHGDGSGSTGNLWRNEVEMLAINLEHSLKKVQPQGCVLLHLYRSFLWLFYPNTTRSQTALSKGVSSAISNDKIIHVQCYIFSNMSIILKNYHCNCWFSFQIIKKMDSMGKCDQQNGTSQL